MISLSVNQSRLVEDDYEKSFFQACAGSGKTETVARRFIRKASDSSDPRGIALLSFTNAATDAMQSRINDLGVEIGSPHYLGTFDSFLWNFFVRPFRTSHKLPEPQYKPNWIDFGEVAKFNDHLNLDDIDFSKNDLKNPIKRELDWTCAQVKESVEHAKEYRQYLIASLNMFDSERMRSGARVVLNDMTKDLIGIVSSRFKEVIVDEVQDCNAEDLLVVEKLAQCGVRVILIGDLEQSIFGFRGSIQTELDKKIEEMGFKRAFLNDNFRSSPVICDAISKIRGSEVRDIASGENEHINYPVQVVRYTDIRNVSEVVDELLDGGNFETERSNAEFWSPVYLGESWNDACLAANGIQHKKIDIDDSSVRLVIGISKFYQNRDKRGRQEAVSFMRLALRELTNRLTDKKDWNPSEDELDSYFGSWELTREALLRIATRSGDPAQIMKTQFDLKLKGALAAEGLVSKSPKITPDANRWAELFASDGGSELKNRYSSIHSFKGQQAETVVVAVSKPKWKNQNSMFRDWAINKQSSEDRRKLYVASSRARKLLIFAVEDSQFDEIERILVSNRISYESHRFIPAR